MKIKGIVMKKLRLAAALIFCGLLLCTGCGGRKSEQYRREGDTLLRLGQLEEAKNAYQRAQEMNPENASAKLGMGRCLLLEGETDDAMESFRAAISIDPASVPAYEEAVHILLRQNEGGQALTMAEALKEKNLREGTRLAAHVLQKTNRIQEAMEILKTLAEQYPDDVKVKKELIAVALESGNAAEAELIIRSLLETGADQSDLTALNLMLVEACRAQGKNGQIAEEYEQLAREKPGDTAIELSLIQALLGAGRLEDAVREARVYHEKNPDSGWSNHILGTCLLAQKNFGEALPHLERASALLPNQHIVSRNLALAQKGGQGRDGGVTARPVPVSKKETGFENLAEAAHEALPRDWLGLWKHAALKPMLARRADFLNSGDLNVSETLALAAFCDNNKAALEQLIEELPAESPLRGFFDAVNSRNADLFVQHMKNWKETDEQRIVLRANAEGLGLAMLGARLQGVEILSRAISASPEYGITYYNLAQVLRAAGQHEIAARALQKLLAIAVNNVDIHYLLWITLREAGAKAEAQRAAEVAFSLFPEREGTNMNLAQVYLESHNLPLAEEVLRRAMLNFPESQRFKAAMARLLLHANRLDELPAFMEDFNVEEGDAAGFLGDMAGFHFAARKDWDKVLAITGPYLEEDAPPFFKWLRALAFLQSGINEEASKVIESIKTPANPQERICLAVFLDQSPDTREEASLIKALRESPEALRNYVLALAYLAVPSYVPAMEKMKAADNIAGGHPLLAVTALDCAAKALPVDEQQKVLEEFSGRYPDSARMWLSLARLHGVMENTEAQGNALEKAVEIAPAFAEAWRQRAYFLERQEAIEEAIPAYERLLELVPDDLAGNNNLAYCLLLTEGDLDKALAHAERAKNMRPTEPNVLHTLGLVQLRRGDLEKSADNLKLAITLRPADPTFLLDYGQLLIAQNSTEEAVVQIETALKYSAQIGLPFPRRAEAENILRRYK